MELYDVIIIGGGPSGSTAATLLARQGKKVLLLEKEKFPREHIGESLIPLSYGTLKKLGVVEELEKISPRKPGVNFVEADGVKQSLWCFKNVVKDKSYLSFHVKRSMFDEMLLNNSRKSGAEVKEETAVKNVILDKPDGTVEVHTENKQGQREQFFAKFIIDASGQSTFLGSKMGVKTAVQGLDRVALWSHWSNSEFDVPLQQGVIKIVYLGGTEKLGWVWVIPISADNLSIGVVVNNSFIKAEKAKYTANGSTDWKNDIYMQEIADSPAVNKLLKNATMSHKVQVNGDYSYFCDKKYGSNYAMVGDAGAFLDPIFSSGIFVGMHSAELVAEALEHKFNGDDKPMDEAYGQIYGAVKLLEKFIKLFYSPDIVNFAHMGDTDKMLTYSKTETVYSIFHYLLAGDFFKNHEKYSEFIDTMRDTKMIHKFQHLIDHSKDVTFNATCGEDFDEMYGKMTEALKFDLNSFV